MLAYVEFEDEKGGRYSYKVLLAVLLYAELSVRAHFLFPGRAGYGFHFFRLKCGLTCLIQRFLVEGSGFRCSNPLCP